MTSVCCQNLLTRPSHRAGVRRPCPPSGSRLAFGPRPTARRQRLAVVRAEADSGSERAEVLFKTLPAFPLPRAVMPCGSGSINVFEPRYLEMFHDMRRDMRRDGSPMCFLHCLSPASAPPTLLEDAVGGLPRLGTCVEVVDIKDHTSGTMQVDYVASRRMSLISVETYGPYKVATAEWYDDDAAACEDEELDAQEWALYQLLQEVTDLTGVLNPGVKEKLPAAVLKYAPPPPSARGGTRSEALESAGYTNAARNVAQWERGNAGSRRKKQPAGDPYDHMRASLPSRRRQELFSFAAAQTLELGPIEAIALIQARDTAARINWVGKIVEPYVQQLRTKAQLQRVMKEA